MLLFPVVVTAMEPYEAEGGGYNNMHVHVGDQIRKESLSLVSRLICTVHTLTATSLNSRKESLSPLQWVGSQFTFFTMPRLNSGLQARSLYSAHRESV